MTINFLKTLLYDSGEVLKSGFGSISNYKTKHNQNNIVTEMDIKSENVITNMIEGNYPGHNILGEKYGYLYKIVFKTEKIINVSMIIFLVLVFAGIFIFEDVGNSDLASYAYLFLPAFLLNFISMFAGYLLALSVGIRNRGRFTIAIQVGL